MMIKVDLEGTTKYVIYGIINNNWGNGLTTIGTIFDENDALLRDFTNVDQFDTWWQSVYGPSKVGTDKKYIIINSH